MRKLFEIEADIRAALDNMIVDDDGVIDPECFEKISALQEERETKLENVVLYYKELLHEAEDLKTEAEILTKRARVCLNRAEGLKTYLSSSLNGEPLKTARVLVSYRKSEQVVINEDLIPKKYLEKVIEYKADKKKLKELLKSGEKIKGVSIIEKNNIQIK